MDLDHVESWVKDLERSATEGTSEMNVEKLQQENLCLQGQLTGMKLEFHRLFDTLTKVLVTARERNIPEISNQIFQLMSRPFHHVEDVPYAHYVTSLLADLKRRRLDLGQVYIKYLEAVKLINTMGCALNYLSSHISSLWRQHEFSDNPEIEDKMGFIVGYLEENMKQVPSVVKLLQHQSRVSLEFIDFWQSFHEEERKYSGITGDHPPAAQQEKEEEEEEEEETEVDKALSENPSVTPRHSLLHSSPDRLSASAPTPSVPGGLLNEDHDFICTEEMGMDWGLNLN